MPAGTTTAQRVVHRRRIMPVVMISLVAGLGSVISTPHAGAAAASMSGFATRAQQRHDYKRTASGSRAAIQIDEAARPPVADCTN
jgi:hypothetical protein